MCDCFHLAFPNWHAASSGTGAGRRLRAPEPGTEDDSVCDEPSQFTGGERPRPQGSSPVEEFPEKYSDSDKECDGEHDPHHKGGGGKKSKKSGLSSMFEKRSTPKMSKLKEAQSPESEVIVKTAKDGCAEGLVYGGGGKDGIFIKQVVPESPASKSLSLKEGDQILSATVYFDNVSYEDAIQILEHAQAYKVKLCLKRKPDITETEAAMESDIIPEEEVYAPEMRQQGKTKRRGDARISWPKFPSFGKGRKSRFTRSHSTSEADEQRKLELSPTTSDTESPIKTQEALKGKKKQKLKLSSLTKRGRISSSEDTDAPTTGQISTDVYQTASEMLSPEGPESLSGESPKVFVTESLRLDQDDQQTVQHKVELISIDSTLKTEDLTLALTQQGSPSGVKSPKDKKKKKEKSELKMKILGKDKSHKKDAKAKSSPKRLKTLGASLEVADQPAGEKPVGVPGSESQMKLLDEGSGAKMRTPQMEFSVPKVDLDISDVAFMRKSPQKSKEQSKKEKDAKEKKETKTFKLPRVGLTDITPEEAIQPTNVNVEESLTKPEKLKGDDPYDRLSKSGTHLPKREEIEIPGMEDLAARTSAKGIKEPKVRGHYDDIQTDTVQMSIDVDSVKEAVSKLPGFKLPKVDTSGVPIPEEITVIDANAQRISVKTPTKVADARAKQEVHITKFGVIDSPEISIASVKVPRISTAGLASEELLLETNYYKKTDKKTEIYKREDINIPGIESARKDLYKLPKQNFNYQHGSEFLGERTILLTQEGTSSTETRTGNIVTSDIKIPGTDNIEYIDSISGSPANMRGFGVHIDATKPKANISLPGMKEGGAEGHTIKVATFEAPEFSVHMPDLDKTIDIDRTKGVEAKYKLPKLDVNIGNIEVPMREHKVEVGKPKADVDVKPPEVKAGFKLPTVDVSLGKVDAFIPETKLEVRKPQLEIKPLETEVDLEGQGGKFKIPKLGIKMPKMKGPDFDLNVSKKDAESRAEVKLPEAPNVDVTLQGVEVSLPHQNLEVGKPGIEVKPLEAEVELDGQGSRFKMPKLGIKMPKIKGPEFDFSSSKKDVDVSLPEAKAKVTLPQVPDVDINLGSVEAEKPELEIKPLQGDVDLEGQGSKFKMPKLGIKMPKIKGPEFDFSSSKKDADVTLPEAKAEVKLPKSPDVNVILGSVDVSLPEQKLEVKSPELQVKPLKIDGELDGQGSKFKMPELGIKMPQVKGPEFHFGSSKTDGDVVLPEAKAEVKVPDVDIKAPGIKVTTKHTDGSPSKFKMPTFKLPKFGIGSPNISAEVPDMDKDVKLEGIDIKIPKVESGVDISAPSLDIKSDVNLPEPSAKVDIKAPQIEIPEAKMEVHKPELDVKPVEFEVDGQGGKFKMPKFGISMPKMKGPDIDLSLSKKDVDVELPEAKVEVKVPEVDLKGPSAEVDVKVPEFKVESKGTDGSPSKFKMPSFSFSKPKVKMPDIDLSLSKKDTGITSPEIKAEVKVPKIPEIDVNLGKAEVAIPVAKMEVHKPELEVKPVEFEVDGQGGKFKMPKFGISMPKMKGPDIDLSFSKKDVDVELPEAKVEVKVPEVDVKGPSAEVDVKVPEFKVESKGTDGSPSKFKMPSFSFSKPKVKMPDIDLSLSKKDSEIKSPEIKAEVKVPEVPKIDVDLGKAEVSLPEAKIEVQKPELEVKSGQYELDGQGGKFKMPKFGISMPKMKGPDIDLSLSKKDVDVELPEVKVEVKVPEVDVKGPSAEVEVKAPEFKVESKGTDGSPSKFKMPSFSFSKPKVKMPDIDLSLSKKDTEIKSPEIQAQVKLPEVPGIDVNLGKAEVQIPEAKMEVHKPELEVKPVEYEVDGQGGKFKMPKFGIAMPKMKGPDFDLSLSKKDVDMEIPETKVEVKVPEVDVKGPSAEVEVKVPEFKVVSKEDSPSKFKMPSFSFSKPKVKMPDIDLSLSKKDTEITSPEIKAEVKVPEIPEIDVNLGKAEVSIPEAKMEVHKPELEVKPVEVEVDGQGGKFKMPKFGVSMPKIKGPDFDLSFSKKDVDVELPEAKVEVKVPEVDVKGPSAEVDVKAPEFKVASKDTDGSPSKFKMPSFSFSRSKVKMPDIDLSLSKKDTEIKSPEIKAEVKLPEVPEIDINLGKAEIVIPEAKIEVQKPELDVKSGQYEVDGQGGKFKMPKFGISMPKMKGPDFDLSLSKKDVVLPEAKVEVKVPEVDVNVPSAEVEVKVPEIKVVSKEDSPSKFKMPSFSFSKPKVKMPDIDLSVSKKDSEIKSPEIDVDLGKAEVSIPEAKIEVQQPELEVKPVEFEVDGQGGKFKMPKFGVSMPKMKGPDIDLSFSKKDVDVELPEAKVEVKVPDVDVKGPSAEVEVKAPEFKVESKGTDGSPSKFKMPSFSFSKPKVKMPDIDLSLSKKDTEITSPEIKAEVKLPEVPKIDVDLGEAEVSLPEAKIEVQKPELEVKSGQYEVDGQGGKFKMPKFGISMPKMKGPDFDLSFSKKDVDVELPEAKVEVKVPDIDVKGPSAEVEVKAPELKVESKGTDGSPSKFKMPSFSFSKPKVKMPDIDLSLSKKDSEIKSPEIKAEVKLPEVPGIDVNLGKAEVSIPEAKIEVHKPELEVKPVEVEVDGQGGKFKMPKFGVSMPKMKGPDFDLSLSKKDVDVELPEAKVEVKFPDIDVKGPSAEVEVKAPEFKVASKDTDGSPSKFKMPSFSFSRPKVKMPDIDLSLSKKDTEIKSPEIDVDLGKAEVSIPEAKIEVQQPELEVKPVEFDVDGQGGKFKMPKFGVSMPKMKGPDIDLSFSKKDVDVEITEAKVEVKVPEVELKDPKMEMTAPDIDCQLGHVDGSPSKFKLPTFKFPKFGVSMPHVRAEAPELDKEIKIDGADISAPNADIDVEVKGEVSLPEVEVKEPAGRVVIDQPDVEVDGKIKKSRFSMPRFSFSKASVKAPEVDVRVQDVNVELPEGNVEVKGGEINMTSPEMEQGSKFKLPKFGISMPKVTGPEIDLSLSKKDVDVTIPEAKAEVKLPDVDVQGPSAEVEVSPPEIKLASKDKEGSPSKFKMPTFKLPKFGVGIASPTAEVPEVEKEVNIEGDDFEIPEEILEVNIKGPSIDMKTITVEGKGSKFKMPSLGFSAPQVKSSDVTLPEADVQLPEVEVKEPSAKVEIKAPGIDSSSVDGSPSKFKMPTFKLPKFGGGTAQVSVEGPEVEGGDLKLPEAKVEVDLPDVEVKGPSAEVEVKAPEIKLASKDKDGSPSKFKMPTFKLPKFGVSVPSSTIEVPEVDKDVTINAGEATVAIVAPSIETEVQPIDQKTEGQGKGMKFKMPSLGFSGPQVKSPNVDLSLSKTGADVTLPEADVQLPDVEVKEASARVDIKAPGIEVHTSSTEGSPSKFKMPTFKLPKFGGGTAQVSVGGPEVDKDIEVEGGDFKLPEAKAEVKLPDVEIKEPVQGSVSVSAEGDAKGRKMSWSFPKFSSSKANIKAPEAEVILDTPQVEITLPEVKTVEVPAPDVDIRAGVSVEAAADVELDAKVKKPRFSLPRFSFSKQTPKELAVEVSGPEVDVSIPEGSLEVAPTEVVLKQPEGDLPTDGMDGKFKMPTFGFSMPKVKGPEIDVSLTKKEVDMTLPEAKAEVEIPDVDVKAPEFETEIDGKGSKFKMPKFGISMPKVKGPEIDVSLTKKDVDMTLPEAKAAVEIPEGPKVDVDVKAPEFETEIDSKGSKFKMPKFGISMPKVKGPQVDLSSSKTEVQVTVPEARTEFPFPDVDVKPPSGKVEVKGAEIKVQAGNVEGSPSKMKMPTFSFPKFGVSTPKVSAEVPDVDKELKIDGAKLEGAVVMVTAPGVDTEGLSVGLKAKESELKGSESKFRMPNIGISAPKVKGPEIDMSLPKEGAEVTLPEAEVTLPSIEAEGSVSLPGEPSVEAEAKTKRPSWAFPRFSFSRSSGKSPDVDVNVETPQVDLPSPEVKAEVSLPEVEVKGPSGVLSVEVPPPAELDEKLKRSRFSLPKISFSKSSAPEVSAEPLHIEVSLPEGEVIVKQPQMEVKAPELEAEQNVPGSKFKLPKLGLTMSKSEGTEVDAQKDVEVTLPSVKAEVKLPEVEVKESPTRTDAGGSPLKFKMPTLKMPKFGGASSDVTVESLDADKGGAKPEEDVVKIEAPGVDIKAGTPKAEVPESEAPKLDSEIGSPSRFKLPSFKMPRLSFSKPRPEEETSPGDIEGKEKQPETEEETKSPKLTMPSFGEILKTIDVEFSKTETKEDVDASKEETDEPVGKQEKSIKEEATKSPERTGWFKFPKFGLSSPTEPARSPDKDGQKDAKTLADETGDEEASPTCSIQSSDAFADISSAMTSEHTGWSVSSPTKVTVKYSDPETATGLDDFHTKVFTSTTRTELISVEPDLPEKITILSSGLSSSSEDTLKLSSGKIHVITSNIQATPDAEHAKIQTAVQVQPAGVPVLQPEGEEEAASWTVQESQGGQRKVFEQRVVRETSSQRSESKKTIVITKQITHVFDSSEPISGETASSIQRLRDSVHTDKMRFFDGAGK